MRSSGTLSCIAAGAGFGAMGVLGKLAYDDGVTVGTLLAARFALAALVFWALLAASGAGRELRALRRRDVLTALALGAGCYALQAGAYFAALPRMDAGLLPLTRMYTVQTSAAAIPSAVASGSRPPVSAPASTSTRPVRAIALGRESADTRRVGALAPERDRGDRDERREQVDEQRQQAGVHARQRREVGARLGRVAERAQRQGDQHVAALERAQLGGAAAGERQGPEQDGGEGEAGGEQGADRRAVVVGELAEHAHRSEGGDRRDRPPLVQLAQEAEAAELQHREAMLLNARQKSESMLKLV